MKRIAHIMVTAGLILFAGSCSEDFLDTKNLYQKNLENFYQTPQDITEAMGGVYNALYVNGVHSEEHVAANLLSDYMFGGGGPDDISAKNVANFVDPNEDTYRDLWIETYNGVYRSNAIIEAASQADYTPFFDTEQEAIDFRNSAVGEAYFMRGFMMYRAARFFGGMPLINSSETPRDVPRSSFTETFSQIASDFKMAAELMPAISADQIGLRDYGHANRWVAKAYLARTYLFYTGYMTNMAGSPTDVVPLPDGGTLTRSEVVTHLENIMASSGYALVSDFRNLWPYSHVNQSAGQVVLPWAEDEGLNWVGQDGHNSEIGTGNTEVMFALRFAFGNWDWDNGQKYNNRVPLFFGIRGNSLVPFGQGWGWGTVHPAFFNSWDDGDIRKKGSILEVGDAAQATDGYSSPDNADHETGLFNKKYTTLQHGGADGVQGMFYYVYGWSHGDGMQLWAAQDFYYLRYADVLLMHSELTETADGINAVRQRAGLDPVSWSTENLKAERKYEFAFEGLRWFDLVRWGDVENSSNNYYSVVAEVSNAGGIIVNHSVTYRPETKGLLPIPESEIRLSNGVYEQNPGW
ncbi:RagB/SusD family nutrient uptake outer membrane protein [Alkalitalea saponilacus]|uniref:Starch-binding associating with outer membrane n=1 Tax=Alkalitalea saponilacus TaxID=889453 RepID=A0A1T5A2U8_9BACT|nr:RagB/SusD family nutrient uptake outer membrane protein [Alkalitalea saponilacus]ASB48903.1 RagB/SusD family nutrient uptake outer membrane protein [Alkalitalea saponilacus]SKB28963.1 Starch-binding associating with outer membrane [Alkalitalea saponilacus]